MSLARRRPAASTAARDALASRGLDSGSNGRSGDGSGEGLGDGLDTDAGAEEDLGSGTGKSRRRRPEPTPLQRGIALLARREHSRKELIRKLRERGIEDDVAVSTVERLAADGWQSEARFAEMLVRTRTSHGQGPQRIRAELATHGLDDDTVAQALEAHDGQWRQAARDLVLRRFGADLERAEVSVKRKAADFLYRRGFDGDTVRAALRGAVED